MGTDEELSFAYVDAMFEVPMRSPRLMWSWQLDLGVWNLEERRRLNKFGRLQRREGI